MPSQCVAWNCSTRRRGDESDDQTITFHSFPVSRPELLAQWLKCMGEALWKPQRGSVLCSKHFDRSSFLQNYATPRLKQNAVPVYCDKRPDADQNMVDLDQHAAQLLDGESLVATPYNRKRKRKVLRRYDPDEEIANLRQMLEDERTKRRELEQEIYRLRQEKSEMSSKMSKLEASRCKPNIPQSLIPILVDAMAKGVDPLKKADLNRPKRAAPTTTSARKTISPRTITPRPSTSSSATAPPAHKLMLQLPEQILDSNSSKSVSFLVPLSTASTSAEVADDTQNNIVILDD